MDRRCRRSPVAHHRRDDRGARGRGSTRGIRRRLGGEGGRSGSGGVGRRAGRMAAAVARRAGSETRGVPRRAGLGPRRDRRGVAVGNLQDGERRGERVRPDDRLRARGAGRRAFREERGVWRLDDDRGRARQSATRPCRRLLDARAVQLPVERDVCDDAARVAHGKRRRAQAAQRWRSDSRLDRSRDTRDLPQGGRQLCVGLGPRHAAAAHADGPRRRPRLHRRLEGRRRGRLGASAPSQTARLLAARGQEPRHCPGGRRPRRHRR
mmetsp:Transcript_12915/g.40970  ORF Transcript_12915/g.40970 Transcript_12915/m.40970 type:complete len:266 (+) Transcript_12915:179-976(+)